MSIALALGTVLGDRKPEIIKSAPMAPPRRWPSLSC
jgi:hypothetical protein